MRISERRNKVDFYQQSVEKNNREWQFFKTVFAKIDFRRGDQVDKDYLLTHTKVIALQIKFTAGITEDLRVKIGHEFYDVLSVDPHTRRGELFIDIARVDNERDS